MNIDIELVSYERRNHINPSLFISQNTRSMQEVADGNEKKEVMIQLRRWMVVFWWRQSQRIK